jgi:predicted GH43/DUF377 family glycosyl hydrolase
MTEYAQAPNGILLMDKLRVFFCTRTAPDSAGQYISRIGFIDLDSDNPRSVLGISEEPVLDLGLPGSFDEHGTYPFSAVVTGDTVTAIYGGWTRCSSVPFDVSLGLARAKISNLKFEKVGNGPVLTKSLHEPFVVSSPKIRFFNNKFYLFYIAGSTWSPEGGVDPVYSIRMASSVDGEKWEKYGQEIVPKVLDEFEAQASPDVFEMNGFYHMLFCYRFGSDFRNSQRGYRIGYAYSYNLVDWTRDDSLSNLGRSASGWDSQDVSYPNVIEANGETYCFYLGNEVGRRGFGVARLLKEPHALGE